MWRYHFHTEQTKHIIRTNERTKQRNLFELYGVDTSYLLAGNSQQR